MSLGIEFRMRAARHFEGVLAALDTSWHGGEYESSRDEFEQSWPQIQRQYRWLQHSGEDDPERRAARLRYPRAGRSVLRGLVPAETRRPWFEALADPANPPALRAVGLCELATCWKEEGELSRAFELAREALALTEGGGGDRRLRADALFALGSVQNRMALYRDSAARLSECLALYREVLGATHPDALEALTSLASTWDDLGEFDEMVDLLLPAVRALEDSPQARHPKVAACYRMLGLALRQTDLEAAERYCARALALDQELLPPGHPTLAVDLNDLATVLYARGDRRGARDRLIEAIAVERACFGDQHPNLVLRWNNLGAVYRRLGDPRGAIGALERARSIATAVLGDPHLHLANAWTQLSRCHADLQDVPSAIAALERAIDVRRRLGPDGDPEALESDRAELAALITARE